MDIPFEYENQTVYRTMGENPNSGILACGFLKKAVDPNKEAIVEQHTFRYYGALLVLSGEGRYEDDQGNDYMLSQGSFVQRLPGRMHKTIVNSTPLWQEFFICIGKELFDSLNSLNIINGKCPVLFLPNAVERIGDYVRFYRDLKSCPQEQLPAMLLRALDLLYSIQSKNEEGCQKRRDSDIAQALNYIDEHIREHIRTDCICSQSGISYESFRKRFREITGKSPYAYILNKKMELSVHIMLHEGKTVSQTAWELGYPDVYSFSKQFKKSKGVSPVKYMKDLIEGKKE